MTFKNINEAIAVLIEKLEYLKNIIDKQVDVSLIANPVKEENVDNEKFRKFKIHKASDWLRFQAVFQESFPNYYHYLHQNYANRVSQSEFRILLILKTNRCYNSIAEQLGISRESVRVSVYRTRVKLGFKNNLELLSFLDSIRV
jgi:DNA-binding CsgD family transcriptional regulator